MCCFSSSESDAMLANGVNENRPVIRDRWLDYCNSAPRKRQCKYDVFCMRVGDQSEQVPCADCDRQSNRKEQGPKTQIHQASPDCLEMIYWRVWYRLILFGLLTRQGIAVFAACLLWVASEQASKSKRHRRPMPMESPPAEQAKLVPVPS